MMYICGWVLRDRLRCGSPPAPGREPVCWACRLWRQAAWSETCVGTTGQCHCFWGWWRTCQSRTAAAQGPVPRSLKNSRNLTLGEMKQREVSALTKLNFKNDGDCSIASGYLVRVRCPQSRRVYWPECCIHWSIGLSLDWTSGCPIPGLLIRPEPAHRGSQDHQPGVMNTFEDVAVRLSTYK